MTPSTTCSTASGAPDIHGAVTPSLTDLQERLGHRFADEALLRRALAHRSWCAEAGEPESNERLEYLGDAVLGWVVADLAYRRHTDLPEGKLTDLRKSVVNATALAAVARDLGLGAHLLLGKGESRAGGRDKDSILSDAFEAVLGAVYLDGGPGPAFELVERELSHRMDLAAARLDRLDHKTVLQEMAVRQRDVAPVYVLTESGPDHDKRFVATVFVDGVEMGRGEGRSKKTAEQAAAELACGALAEPAPPADED